MPSFLISWKFPENKPRAVVFIIGFMGGGGDGGFLIKKQWPAEANILILTKRKLITSSDLFNSITQWSHYYVLLSELDLVLILAFFSNIKNLNFEHNFIRLHNEIVIESQLSFTLR